MRAISYLIIAATLSTSATQDPTRAHHGNTLIPYCPTLTVTGTICPSCIRPNCLQLATATQNCGCPEVMATTTIDIPCGNDCANMGCITSYAQTTTNACEPTDTCHG